jgi:hypothetical protein
LKKLFLLVLLAANAWSEAHYTFETEIRTDWGREYKPRVVTVAGHPAEIKLGPPDHPDVRMVLTPRPASSRTVMVEGSVEMRTQHGGRDVVNFRAETNLGDNLRFECAGRSFSIQVSETP